MFGEHVFTLCITDNTIEILQDITTPDIVPDLREVIFASEAEERGRSLRA